MKLLGTNDKLEKELADEEEEEAREQAKVMADEAIRQGSMHGKRC